ncbi:MAG: ATP-binding cassette domain-containing protein [Gemmatimonadetes bacterium]|nr:ATP-binding cassette domain-containing protein [Gemmatimonadota bacterium]
MSLEGHAVEAVGLTKRFGDLLAVDRVSFGVRRGEIFGFLGPNGAGKTTTVRMLTTLLAPSAGTAVIEGRDIIRDPYGVRDTIGVVPETSNVYVELSAWNNLMFSAELYGVPRRARADRSRELLGLLGLWERRHDRALDFSKGMRRRLAITMALVHRAKVLFLDEPTSGLDVQSSILIRNLVRSLRKEGATVFLTTHQMEEANQMCDRVAIINRGRLACVDAPERLRQTAESVRSVEVSFSGGDDALSEDMGRLEGVIEWRRDGDKLRLFTSDPGALVPLVVDLARKHDARLLSLNTLGPTLEDVFVRVTGLDTGAGPEERSR